MPLACFFFSVCNDIFGQHFIMVEYSFIIQNALFFVNSLMVTSVTNGGTQKLSKIFKIFETYWRDHSLESS
jgi:hypothetical protein